MVEKKYSRRLKMMVRTEKLNKIYKISKNNKFQALNNIDLEIKKGEIVAILGESGSGKSTLMNILGGLDTEYTGKVYIDNKDIGIFNDKKLDEYRKNQVGFVFQSFNLISHLTVLENVTIAMTLSNESKENKLNRSKEILYSLGLETQLYKKPNQLSGGQKQRVAIARALINNPKIILADEPTGSLDKETSIQILNILKDISKKGITIIMVTHSNIVASYCNRIINLSDGKIISNKFIKENTQQKGDNKKENNKKGQLSLMSSIKLALNNIKLKLTRNLFVALGGAIGIMGVITMLSLGEGIKNYINDKMNENVNPLNIEISKPIKPEEYHSSSGIKTFTNEEINEINEVESIINIEKVYSNFVANLIIKDEEKNIFSQSHSTLNSDFMSSNLLHGEMPKEKEIIISTIIANMIDENTENVLGKEIEIVITEKNDVLNENFVISGIYKAGFQLYFNYSDIESLYNNKGLEFDPNSLIITVDDEKQLEKVKEKLKFMGYSPSIQEQLINIFKEMLDVITYVLAGISAISLFVSAIMILVVLYISVVERTKEIGILKAIGARRKDIKRIFVSEAFLIGFLSGIIGIMLSFIISIGVNQYTYRIFKINVSKISSNFIILGLCIGIVVSVLSGLFPASKAAKLDPIESLRHE